MNPQSPVGTGDNPPTLFDTGEIRRGAAVSTDGLYRYRLWRAWGTPPFGDGPRLGWIMLNPSTADGTVDDQTVRRCMHYARREGYAGIEVVNLYPWRATVPDDLPDVHGVACPPGNDDAWEFMFAACPVVVAAWGATLHTVITRRGWPHPVAVVRDSATVYGTTMLCLGYTSGKHPEPRHPSRLGNAQRLDPWR